MHAAPGQLAEPAGGLLLESAGPAAEPVTPPSAPTISTNKACVQIQS